MKHPDIGMMGYAGAGKDTAADYFVQRLEYERASFAAPLKEIAKQIGWNGIKDERGRGLLQDLGMAGRQYDQDLWIKRAADQAPAYLPIVWTDVRFRNEADFVRSRGGIIVEIRRKDVTPQAEVHVSESEHRRIRPDFIVDNEGTITELHAKLWLVASWIISK